MSSIDNSYQSDLHNNNTTHIKLDEIYKYIKSFNIENMNQTLIDKICKLITNLVISVPNEFKLLNMIRLDGFTDINYILNKIACLTKKSETSTTIFREKHILEFLRLYYDSYNGTLTDKLYLFEYCVSKDIFKNYIYNSVDFANTNNIRLTENILQRCVNEGFDNITSSDKGILMAKSISHILYNRYIEILQKDISILKNTIEKQKNDKIELKYKLYYEYDITEKGICNMITEYAFPSLDKTIMLEQIISYKVLFDD